MHVYKELQLLPYRENRNYSFKMFLMSDFNPALIFLANIYTDGFSNRQTTEVYANAVMQVSVFVSVNYNGNSDGIEDKIRDYVRDNVVIYEMLNNGDREEVDWVYSETSNGFPHDIEYNNKEGSSSDIRTPLYFTVPLGSAGKHRWIAKMEEQETSVNTPITINVRKFQLSADGSQIELVKRVHRNHQTLCVLRYKPGVFPEAQMLMKAYKNKGIKFTKTGGNSWLSIYHITPHPSGVFVGYKDNYINVFKDLDVYKRGDYESDRNFEMPILTAGYPGIYTFSSSEIKETWAEGVAIMQSTSFFLMHTVVDLPMFPVFPFHYKYYEFQDNFGNIVAIEFDVNEDYDWELKGAIVRYP